MKRKVICNSYNYCKYNNEYGPCISKTWEDREEGMCSNYDCAYSEWYPLHLHPIPFILWFDRC
jgi:hypothetical protein